MKRTLTTLALTALLAACGTSSTTWEVSNLAVVSDDCEVHDPADPLAGNFMITIDGSNVTMEHETLANLGGTTSDYIEGDNVVTVNGSSQTSVENTDCTAGLAEQFTLTLDDPLLRLENNDTLSVVWDHDETDESTTPGACAGDWFVTLPCASELTFTLTKI